jgi:nucleotidyltransferase substrate binding protein (TIGR01987 family)
MPDKGQSSNINLANGDQIMNKEIRWEQRFANFEKAFQTLERTVAIEHPSEAERGGLIQFFEMAFELSWKTLKDYLEADGFMVKSPRDVLKQAFQLEIFDDGHVWIEALDDQNLAAHTYNEETAVKIEKLIREKYFPAIASLYAFLKAKVD